MGLSPGLRTLAPAGRGSLSHSWIGVKSEGWYALWSNWRSLIGRSATESGTFWV